MEGIMSFIENSPSSIRRPKAEIATSENIIWYDENAKSTLKLLAIPAIYFAIKVLFQIPVPKLLHLSVFAIIGMVVVYRAFSNMESLIALAIIYIPLAKMMPMNMGAGINGTNIFLILLIGFTLLHFLNDPVFRNKIVNSNRLIVTAYGFLTLMSGVTVTIKMGGIHHLMGYFHEYKAWLDQVIMMFVFAFVIRSREQALRIVLYMMIGSIVIIIFGLEEVIDKSGRSSLEKSRVLGPMGQPNDFGAFIAYTIGPWVGLALARMTAISNIPVALYLMVAIKVLVTTFSRGALLGFIMAGLAATQIRGKRYVFMGAIAVIVIALFVPSLLPESIIARFNQTTEESAGDTKKLDKSSEHRLILWGAAVDMTLEDPLLGKGFKAFPALKGMYTESDVHEGDPHNMYLYIASQMGIPAIILFIAIFVRLYFQSRKLFRLSDQHMIQGVALGGTCVAASVLTINMFGSRMINVEVSSYAWIYCLVIGFLIANNSPKEVK